jgi:predicted Zn-dependent protease
MQSYFYQLADCLQTCLHDKEQSTCWFSAESSDFVRFNRSAIRQPGHVRQLSLHLQYIIGQVHLSASFHLTGDLSQDQALIAHEWQQLRIQSRDLPEDPYLLLATEVHSTTQQQDADLPATEQMVADILEAAQGTDMVGLLTTGSQYRGFANSCDQRNWYATRNVIFDWSLFHADDKAVKSNYAGFVWDRAAFMHKFAEARRQLQLLALPPVSIAPGSYRVYLTPTALNELISMLNWGGFSEKALRTRQSCLRKLQAGDVQLHPSVHLSEDSSAGLDQVFQEQGFIKPERIPLIANGRLQGSMIAPRTAQEYGIAANGAGDAESTRSLVMQGGDLAMRDALQALGTGIYISNLWYLNFSDRENCRITGMTRFACFWVEAGEIRAPLNVMRFDESLYRILGEDLLALTQETEVLMDDSSWGERHTGGTVLPGALLQSMRFVL